MVRILKRGNYSCDTRRRQHVNGSTCTVNATDQEQSVKVTLVLIKLNDVLNGKESASGNTSGYFEGHLGGNPELKLEHVAPRIASRGPLLRRSVTFNGTVRDSSHRQPAPHCRRERDAL